MRRSAARNPDSGPAHRRRIRNPVTRFPSRPPSSSATPLLPWKSLPGPDPLPGSGSPTKTRNPKNADRVSARRLAAGMWTSEFHEIEPGLVHVQQLPYGLKHGSKPKNRISSEFQSSAALPNPLLERATKWDAECSKPSEEVYQSFDHLKHLMDQQITKASTLEVKLKAELSWARGRIGELESKQHSSKKKLEAFLKKHAEEKASWRTREHEKIRAVIDGMRGDLSIERKNRRRTEVLNSKLIEELAEAKKSAKRFLQDYEKEKKARELVEEVCNELAMEVGEDRAEVEEVKRESVRVREELEEERSMLQMAEVWREERVQMKLVDAKQALEDQCSQLKNLKMELEAFLMSRKSTSSDGAEIREAELLIEAVAEAVKMQDVKAFTYQPPPDSDDIYAIFEELQQRVEPKEREIDQCHDDSPASGASQINTASPATDIFLGKPMNESVDDDSEWETLSNDNPGSSNSQELSDGSNCRMNETLMKNTYTSKPWRSPCTDNGENYKETSVEASANERLSKGGLIDVEFSLPNLEHWSSPDSVKPHASRGMKGCIEWPRGGAHKHSLKAKLLEARLESHKVQISHVLKQKI